MIVKLKSHIIVIGKKISEKTCEILFLRIVKLFIFSLILFCSLQRVAHADDLCGLEPQKKNGSEGMLFQITKKDLIFGYVFGSLHLGYSSMKVLPHKVQTALNKSTKIYFEKDMRLRPDELRAYADTILLPMSKKLGTTLNSDAKEKVVRFFKEHDLSGSLDESMKELSVLDFVERILRASPPDLGKNPSLDDMILKFGLARQLPIASVETFADITRAVSKISNEDWSAYTSEAFLATQPSCIDCQKMRNEHPACVAAMSIEDDSNGLEVYLKKYYKKFPAEFAKDKNMIFSRNSNMATAIKKSLSQDEIIFVAIGAMHVIGDDGVAQRLRNMGYKVEPVFE